MSFGSDWRFALAALSCVALSACASGGVAGGLSSPYLRPEGSNHFYKYGNFCGPGLPVAEGQSSAENLAQVMALSPVDDIDFACKVHDLCYLRFGVQPTCDGALSDILGGALYRGSAAMRCTRLSSEVSTAVLLRSATHNNAVSIGAAPATVPLGAVNAGMHGVVTTLYAGAGWPREGECVTGRAPRVSALRNTLTLARLYHESGYDNNPEARRRYRESFTLDGYLNGSW